MLLDPDTLKAVIPGCHHVERIDDARFRADVTIGIGPVKGRYRAEVTLSDLDPPRAVTLGGRAEGALGFGEGEGRITLAADDKGGTTVRYVYDAAIGGKIASIGGRLLDGAARAIIGQFFAGLARQAGGPHPSPAVSGAVRPSMVFVQEAVVKPAPFDYVRADTLEEALAALANEGGEARILAGGQSLMAMLNMRLAKPKSAHRYHAVEGPRPDRGEGRRRGGGRRRPASGVAGLACPPRKVATRRARFAVDRARSDPQPRNDLRLDRPCRSQRGNAARPCRAGRRGAPAQRETASSHRGAEISSPA